MSPHRLRNHRGQESFPRVSGDEPAAWWLYVPYIKFSPRERG